MQYNRLPIAIFAITTVALLGCAFNIVQGASSDSANLLNEVQLAVKNHEVALHPDDDYLETLAPTDRTKLLIGYTFYNLLFDSRLATIGKKYNSIGINATYSPNRVNIYFIDPKFDKSGLLVRYGVYNARSFPQIGIILVNVDFIKKLIALQPYTTNLTGDPDANVGEQVSGHHGDQVFLKLEKSVEGVAPWSYDEFFKSQALFIAMYVVIHEIGHIHDFDVSGADAYARKQDKEKEEYADDFFAKLFVHLGNVKEFDALWPTAFSFATTGMQTFLSHDLFIRFEKTETDIVATNNTYYIKDSVFANHPPLAYRLLRVLYYTLKERNASSDVKYSDEAIYKVLLNRVKLQRSLIP